MSAVAGLGLCLVTDRGFVPRERFLTTVDEAIAGGVTMVQLRDKEPGRASRDVYDDGRALRELCAARRVPLIVNDRLDLAMALDADGVHLGQCDLPVQVARRLWPQGALFGSSVSSLGEALRARRDGADYLGAGAVFATASKVDASDAGLDELARIVKGGGLPVIAIGGIGISNASAVAASGCAGIAVISAIWGSQDPGAAARALAEAFWRGRPDRRPDAEPGKLAAGGACGNHGRSSS